VTDAVAASKLTTALFILRVTAQHFIQTFDGEELRAQIDTVPGDFRDRHAILLGRKAAHSTSAGEAPSSTAATLPSTITTTSASSGKNFSKINFLKVGKSLSWELVETLIQFIIEKDVT
jgi:hypothetical protein